LEELEQSISPRTRAILVAHLFGSRVDMEPLVDIAQRHRLFLVEDCAQAFVGHHYSGHAQSDCSMFSFGPIKTATALGGAVLRVRNSSLRHCMLQIQHYYPVQSRRAYVARVAKYASLHAISNGHTFGALVRGYAALGSDYDRAISSAARSFGQSNLFEHIRQRPCGPLLTMLERRIARFEEQAAGRLRRRADRGARLARSLPAGMIVGAQNPSHTYWAIPVRVANVAETLVALRTAGFDATARSSMVRLADPRDPPAGECRHANWLEETIFLPNGDNMPDAEWIRMAGVLRNVARVVVADGQHNRRPSAARFPVISAT
jgi:dTDP-4-amino-4,6-dideoxygalactose transaminase